MPKITVQKDQAFVLDLVKHSTDFNFSIVIVHNSSQYALLSEDLKSEVFYFIQQQLNNQTELWQQQQMLAS